VQAHVRAVAACTHHIDDVEEGEEHLSRRPWPADCRGNDLFLNLDEWKRWRHVPPVAADALAPAAPVGPVVLLTEAPLPYFCCCSCSCSCSGHCLCRCCSWSGFCGLSPAPAPICVLPVLLAPRLFLLRRRLPSDAAIRFGILLLTFQILALSQAPPTRKAESGVQGVRQHWRPPSLMAPDSCCEACRGNYLDNQSGATAHPLQQIELFRCRCGSCLQLLRKDAPPDGRMLMSKALQHNELVRCSQPWMSAQLLHNDAPPDARMLISKAGTSLRPKASTSALCVEG
jgi:hypothetical protein